MKKKAVHEIALVHRSFFVLASWASAVARSLFNVVPESVTGTGIGTTLAGLSAVAVVLILGCAKYTHTSK